MKQSLAWGELRLNYINRSSPPGLPCCRESVAAQPASETELDSRSVRFGTNLSEFSAPRQKSKRFFCPIC